MVGSIDGGGWWKGVENVACDSVYAEEIKGLEGLFCDSVTESIFMSKYRNPEIKSPDDIHCN